MWRSPRRRRLADFDRLGAAPDAADAAAALLRSLGERARTAPRSADLLSGREREVLRLLGLGQPVSPGYQ
jgi:DNA-binding NarL/FixJ family response regulator